MLKTTQYYNIKDFNYIQSRKCLHARRTYQFGFYNTVDLVNLDFIKINKLPDTFYELNKSYKFLMNLILNTQLM